MFIPCLGLKYKTVYDKTQCTLALGPPGTRAFSAYELMTAKASAQTAGR